MASFEGWKGVRMNNRTIAAVWTAGILLAALIYAVGPDDALASLFRAADMAGEAI